MVRPWLLDFGFWAKLDAAGCRIVTRLKANTKHLGAGPYSEIPVRLSAGRFGFRTDAPYGIAPFCESLAPR
jgi:hypothetical protein